MLINCGASAPVGEAVAAGGTAGGPLLLQLPVEPKAVPLRAVRLREDAEALLWKGGMKATWIMGEYDG